MAFRKRDQELPQELKDKRNLASLDLLAGDYEKAVVVFEDIIKSAPKNGQIWLEYTHTLLGLGKKEEAKKAYQSVKKFTRKEESVFGIGNSRTMVEFGILMEEEGETDTAEQIYQAATNQEPDWYKPWFLYASIYKKNEKFDRAEEIYREALDSVSTERERLLIGLGEILTLQHRFVEGLETRRQATKENPEFAEAWFSFAVDSYQFGDYDEAEHALAKAKELSKGNQPMMDVITQTVKMLEDHLKKCPEGMDEGEFAFSVGVVHYQNQDFSKARDYLKRAVRLRPKHAESWTILAGSLAQLKEFSEAEKACKTAISLDSKSVAAYQVLSGVRAMQGDMDAAVSTLKRGIEANPTDPTLPKLLADAEKAQGGDVFFSQDMADAEDNKREALTLLAQGNLKKALKSFKKSLKNNPNDADTWAHISLIHVNLQKFDEGEKAAREAIRLEENNAIAWGVLGAALGDAGKTDEAQEALTKAVELDPNNVSNILPLGFIYLQKGNLDMAQILFEKSAKLRPKVAVVWQMLAQVYTLQGKDKESADALDNAQKYTPAE
ncbi:MAG: tetratricopeptide repeat protein [Candidatus Thorarchaeota archaeon]